MPRKADLSGERDIGSDAGAAGDADLGAEDGMSPDLHVVGNLDEVVDLAPLPYHRATEAGAVDGGVGPDFDIIPDFDNACLGDLDVTPILEFVAESTRSDHGPRLKNDPVPKDAALANDRPGMEMALPAQANVTSDEASRTDDGTVADLRSLLDDRKRPNGDPLTDTRRGGDRGGMVNARHRRNLLRGKCGYRHGKERRGILNAQENEPEFFGKVSGNDGHRGFTRTQLG